MKQKLWWLALPVLLCALLLGVKQKRDGGTDATLSRYSQNHGVAFTSIFSVHRDKDKDKALYDTIEVLSTYFIKDRREREEYTARVTLSVDNVGRGGSASTIHGLGPLNRRFPSLSSAQMEELRSVTTKLPENDAPNNANELLIITFKSGNGHETRLYNRANLPQAIRDIYRITGAPLEELPK